MEENQFILDRFPNNNDAAFMNHQLHNPADVLLHYNYGAAAVNKCGKNTSVLTNHPALVRPRSRDKGDSGSNPFESRWLCAKFPEAIALAAAARVQPHERGKAHENQSKWFCTRSISIHLQLGKPFEEHGQSSILVGTVTQE
jgi:hypothetical protein